MLPASGRDPHSRPPLPSRPLPVLSARSARQGPEPDGPGRTEEQLWTSWKPRPADRRPGYHGRTRAGVVLSARETPGTDQTRRRLQAVPSQEARD